MKKLFIHHPLFRLFSPLFSGTVVYLLILLIHNNVEQLQEHFLGEELYVCIGLSFVIHEFSRVLLFLFQRVLRQTPVLLALSVQVVVSLVLCIGLVTLALNLYYRNVLGFLPSAEELWLFNSIFCTLGLIYILLHLSHEYLYKVNTKRLDQESMIKQGIEEDFIRFREGMNPELLFSSFEALIVLIRQQQVDRVDQLMDHLAVTYRYILTQRGRQLVAIAEEMEALEHFSILLDHLPFSKITLKATLQTSFLCVPGSLLKLLELIARNTIRSSEFELTLNIIESEDMLMLRYRPNDRIDASVNLANLKELIRVYTIYSTVNIAIRDEEGMRTIELPKLTLKPTSAP